jgi:hypothetical protein
MSRGSTANACTSSQVVVATAKSNIKRIDVLCAVVVDFILDLGGRTALDTVTLQAVVGSRRRTTLMAGWFMVVVEKIEKRLTRRLCFVEVFRFLTTDPEASRETTAGLARS